MMAVSDLDRMLRDKYRKEAQAALANHKGFLASLTEEQIHAILTPDPLPRVPSARSGRG